MRALNKTKSKPVQDKEMVALLSDALRGMVAIWERTINYPSGHIEYRQAKHVLARYIQTKKGPNP